ncbi:MAG TPA: alpha/beta hydrolase [Rudaea sp.]|nr:alpha/beta hydrolase [Rudaea sp.]
MSIDRSDRNQANNAKCLALGCVAFFSFLAASVNARAAQTSDCAVGAYRLNAGQTIDVAPSSADTLRWRAFTGETGQLHPNKDGSWTSTYGWTNRPDGKTVSFDCTRSEITFGNETGKRIAFDVSETTFESGDVKLVGRLTMPKGSGKVPVVVLVHGSEHDSARDFNPLQRMFPAQGIGAFVYDKRGTGGSGGTYTQDFDVLADDAVTAMKQARNLAGPRAGRVGYQGGSEAGWVVPLAANRAPVDFAIVSFGLAVTVLEEDQESVALDMHFHHHSAGATKKALELARAGERVIEAGGKKGYAEFDALRRKYKSEPWYNDVHGDFVFFVLPLNQKQIIGEVAKNFDFHTPFHYEPMPALRASNTPQLWVRGSDDLEAPSAETAVRIESLIADGKNYTLAVYPGVEHGMTEYELAPDGSRVSTRFAPGYFAMIGDFARDGRLNGDYGDAAIATPKAGANK